MPRHDGNGSSTATGPRRNTPDGSSKGAVNASAQYNQRGSSQTSHRQYSSRDDHQWDAPSPIQYNHDACVLCNEGGHHSADCQHRHLGPLKCGDYGHKAKHHWAASKKMCDNSICGTINNSTSSSTNNDSDVYKLDSDSLVNTDSILNSESLHDVHV